MTASRPLLSNVLYAIGGHGFYNVCQLGVIVLLAKYATPAVSGQYFLALAVAAPVLLFFGLELRGALVADAGSQFTIGSYLAARRVLLIPALLIFAGYVISEAIGGTSVMFLLILVGVFAFRAVWSLAEVGWGTFQRRERLDLMAGTVALRGVALLAPFAILLPLYARLVADGHVSPDRLPEGTALAVLLSAVGTGLVYLFFDRPRVRDARWWDLRWNWPAVWALALQTLPLGLVALLVTLCDSVPRVIVEQQGTEGVAQLGYFGSLAYITLAGNLVILQAATAAANRLAVYYQQNIRAFIRLGAILIAFAVLIGLSVIVVADVFGPWILRVLYRPEYAHFNREFQIIVVANSIALLTNVMGTAVTQMRLFWAQVPVQVITLIATLIAALALIAPDNPVLGAAQTAFVRAVTQLILYAGCLCGGLVFRPAILRRATQRSNQLGEAVTADAE